MSQVIVERDLLNDSRQKSRLQELKITRDSAFQKWQSTGSFGLKVIGRAIGVMALPFILFWGVMFMGMALILTILAQLFKALGIFVSRGA